MTRLLDPRNASRRAVLDVRRRQPNAWWPSYLSKMGKVEHAHFLLLLPLPTVLL
jgi:hypothetical protein